MRLWLLAGVPVLLAGGLLAWIISSGPAESVRGAAYPAVERLAFGRVALEPGFIRLDVLNDGPDRVTIAQVIVDDAFWSFGSSSGRELPHLGRTTLTIPYPWVHGEAHVLRVITSTGVTFDRPIPVAVQSPALSRQTAAVFALIGLYVGVLPVTIGLLWYPFVRRLGRAGLEFVLALTVGLLAYLLIDTTGEALEQAAAIPASYQGLLIVAFGAVAAYLALESVGRWLRGRRADVSGGWTLALLVAVGIGLHNFGEGLAIGSAFALGEAALGTLLIVGFTLHNTTEGLAIVAPMARSGAKAPLGSLVQLGLIGGLPTIAGAWLGGFTYSGVWGVLFLALGAGALAQVIVQIVRQSAGAEPVARHLTGGPVLAGLAAGFAVMFTTAMLIG
jgi:zinc transporter ZupT